MRSRFLVLPVLGLLALFAASAAAEAGCGTCRTRVVYRAVVVKKCAPAVRHIRNKRGRRRHGHATGHIIHNVAHNPCPAGYDKFGYACFYPIHIPRPIHHDGSYGIGYEP